MDMLNLVLNQVKQLLSLTEADDVNKTDKNDNEFGLFETYDTEEVPNGDTFGMLASGDVSDEKIQEFIKKQKILELRQELVTNVKQLLADGSISEDEANSVQELLKGSIDENSTAKLEEFAENIQEKAPETETITNKTQIAGILDNLRSSVKDSILEQLGGLDEIESIVQYDNGNYKINTKDNKSVTAFPSGKFIAGYDSEKRTGFDFFDENGKLTSSTYIDHQRSEAVVQETFDQHEDGGYTQKINDTIEPEIETTVEVSSENEVVSMQKANKNTGEVISSFSAGVDNDMGSIPATEDIKSGLDSSNAELEQLQQEQTDAQNQLTSDQESYTSTETEMTDVISSCDSEIQSGQADLDSANSDLSQAESDVCAAQSDVEKANSDYSKAGSEKDSAQSDLDSANSKVDAQQGVTDTAEADNQNAIQEEQAASDDANAASNDLNTAAKATGDANKAKEGTGADLAQGVQETKAAFNVKNQEQAKVNAAQSEYNSAQAAKSEDKSIWGKIKSWVSNAFNALKNALAGLNKAEAELEKKQREEERLRTIDEKAADELQKREDEQDKAQQVSDAAEVILARKTGEREVTDQEYADALLDLADTVVTRDNAADEYDSALEQFMETYNYKVDAEGNLTDAEGNKVEISQVVGQLEQFVQGAVANKETTQASYESTLQATAQAIEGDEADVERLGNEIETLKQHIAEEEEKLAMQEQMLASLAADKGELNAEKDGAGVVDDFAALFGGSYSKDEDAYNAKKAALEKAILSGNDDDLLEAYKTMYGDNEVIVDSKGNIVDPSEIPANADMTQYSAVKISDLDSETARGKMSQDAVANVEASQIVEGVQNGTFAVGGQIVTMDDLNNALKAQAAQIAADMESAEWDQGILSLGISGVNDFLGIGTSASEMRAQVEHYNNLVDKLSKTTDPREYAAIFEEITGGDFSASGMVQLLAYNGMTNSNGSAATGGEAPEGTYSLDDYVNNVKTAVNEQAEGNPDVLVMTGNSKANEVTADYQQTQKNAKQGIVGVATGVIGAIAGTAAVAAAPFTGGASVALFGVGMAALAGGGAGVALNAADAVHFMDGDKNLDLDFEYSFKEGVRDFALGALNGAVGQISAGAGKAVTGAITKAVVKDGITTTAGQAAGKAAARVAGNAVEGFIDGGISAGGEYVINTAADKNADFKLDEFAESVLQGGGMGAVFNVGANGLMDAGRAIKNHGNAADFMSDVNKALSEGASGNAVADIIAGKLDGDLLVDGKVNKWAVSELMNNADNSLKALAKAGITDDAAMDILNNTSLKAQQTIPQAVNTISNAMKNSQLPENMQDVLKNIDYDNLVTNKAGNIISADSILPDGTKIKLEFDTKGKLSNYTITAPNGNVRPMYDTDASLRQLKELIDMGVVKDSSLADKFTDNASINQVVAHDIDTLYKAVKNGDDITDAFVKKFATADDAAQELLTGDIARIGDSGKVNIKMPDGSMKELNLSTDKYMELFPPVEKFGFQQQNIGDCYLVSTLDALNKNPNTRAQLLSCFTENADGSIDVKFANGSAQLHLEPGEDISDLIAKNFTDSKGKLHQVDNSNLFLVSGSSKGIQALEYLYGLDLADGEIQSLLESQARQLDDYAYQSAIKDFYESLPAAGAVDIEALRKELSEVPFGNGTLGDQDFIMDSIIDKVVDKADDGTFVVNRAQIQQSLNDLSNNMQFDKQLIDDFSDRLVNAQMELPQQMRDGGWMKDVMKKLGFNDVQDIRAGDLTKSISTDANALKQTEDLLMNPDNWDNHVFTVSTIFEEGKDDTFYINKDVKMAYGHAYNVQPCYVNGEIRFNITNPWNTAQSVVMNFDELTKYFAVVQYIGVQ